MSTAQTVLLGAIAGFTIYLGLPVGRVRTQRLRAKAFLNAASAGILVFLLFDILAHATEPVEDAMTTAKAGEGPWGRFAGLGLVYIAGFGVGLLALFYLARAWPRRGRPAGTSIGPGAMAAAEATRPRRLPRCGSACRSPPASACTTSPRGWPSARPPTAARSPWPRC